jgi:hypothetical protein
MRVKAESFSDVYIALVKVLKKAFNSLVSMGIFSDKSYIYFFPNSLVSIREANGTESHHFRRRL